MATPEQPKRPDPNPAQLVDATRRTYLAGERTQLAWWRTGLAALAVAIGVGRVVPELSGSGARWPYALTGVGFALWGIFAIAYGTANREAMMQALREGRFHEGPTWPLRTLSVAGIGLGLLTALLILLD
ncbi:MAG: YidH family protein [Solirubrobacterales bacterium]